MSSPKSPKTKSSASPGKSMTSPKKAKTDAPVEEDPNTHVNPFARVLGDWKVELTLYEDGKPTVHKGTSAGTVVYSNFIESTCEIPDMMPGFNFAGKSILGYDPKTKKIRHTWIDNMSHDFFDSYGEVSDLKSIEMNEDRKDSKTGKMKKVRMVWDFENDDKMVFQTYFTMKEKKAKETLEMKVVYLRA